MSERTKALWALAAVCFFWGTTYIAILIAVRELPVFLFCSVRFIIAGSLMVLWALAKGRRLPRGTEWWTLSAIAFLLLTVGNGTLAWAEKSGVPAGIASLIVVATPFWMVCFARLRGERLRPQALIGLLLGFCGLTILLWPDLQLNDSKSGFVIGAGALMVSSVIWAYGSVYTKTRKLKVDPIMSVGVQKLLASLFLFALAMLRGEPAHWDASPKAWAAIAYLVVFGSMVGYTCYVYALERLPTDQVAVYALVNPIVAVLLGFFFFSERLDIYMLVGSPLVLWGIFLVNMARKRSTEPPVLWGSKRSGVL